MGRPKGLLVRDGIALLRAHVDAFAAAGLRVTVVLGPRVEDHLAVLPPGTRVVLNPRWASTEMSDSAHLGLVGLGPALLTPVDVPPARAATLARLLEADGAAVPAFRGMDGHPVRLPAPHPPVRLDLRLAGAPRIAVDDPDICLNLNRPADWEAWLARSGEK